MNQDAYILVPNIGKKSYQHFFSVCDGHGINGHLVSNFLKIHFPQQLHLKKELLECEQVKKSPKSALKFLFMTISQKLVKESQIDLSFSGSTVVSIYLLHNKLYCANLGDSRAIVCKRKTKVWSCTAVSRDHKPSEENEAERILKIGGRIEPYKDQQGNKIGPLRVWAKNDNFPGLAMTRSMGDQVAQSLGVSNEPEIEEYTLNNEDRIIVIGSDGLWEFIENEDIMKILVPYYEKHDLEGGCEILIELAHNLWVQNSTVIDDITFILIFMNY